VSKAFTKEDAGVPEAPARRLGVPVPEPNFVTAAGLAAAREELDRLQHAPAGDPDRIRELAEHLATAQVAPVAPPGEVGFGSRVTVEDEAGKRTIYRIVGAIEADARRGLVSWQSPIANALWGGRVGESVQLPRGEVEIVELAS
jgi:transcription elongation factor GreB